MFASDNVPYDWSSSCMAHVTSMWPYTFTFDLNLVFGSVLILVAIVADLAYEFIRPLKFVLGWKAVSGMWASSPQSWIIC